MLSRSSSSSPPVFAAADLGATSGRVMAGRVGPEGLDLIEIHRFVNRPVRRSERLHWDLPALNGGLLDGLAAAARRGDVASVGIDTWAVDYGLLDADGNLLGDPYHYRDGRTDGVPEKVWDTVPAPELYHRSGLQHLPFNTVYQLAADTAAGHLAAARTLLLMPDLLTYRLTGTIGAETTNASTTGLLDARSGTWSQSLLDRLGFDRGLFPPLRHPGDPAGTLLAEPAARTGLPEGTPVVSVASHDTASAVVAVPATQPDFAYISCGTWSLAGLELDAPMITETARAANFTNERGVDGTFRFLRNIMGLWLLSESVRVWADQGLAADLPTLLAWAAQSRPFAALIDAGDPVFLAPGDIPARIAKYCTGSGQSTLADQGAVVRCILESLALAHRTTLDKAAELSGRDIRVVHLVGGGSRNELLCQLTADATGLPVIAGPAEAAALGNVLVQACAHGLVGDRTGMRRLVANTGNLRRYEPRGNPRAWSAAAARIGLG